VVNLKVWIDDTVVYHSKNGQKATLSYMNKLGESHKEELLCVQKDYAPLLRGMT